MSVSQLFSAKTQAFTIGSENNWRITRSTLGNIKQFTPRLQKTDAEINEQRATKGDKHLLSPGDISWSETPTLCRRLHPKLYRELHSYALFPASNPSKCRTQVFLIAHFLHKPMLTTESDSQEVGKEDGLRWRGKDAMVPGIDCECRAAF